MSRYRTAIVVLGLVLGALGALTACGALEPDDLFDPGPDGGDAASADTGTPLDASTDATADAFADSDIDAPPDSAADAFEDADSSPPIAPFALSTTASQVYVVRGSEVQVPLTLVSGAGFTGILVSVSGLPVGVTADALTLSSGIPAGMLTLHASISATLGIGQLGITAADGPLVSPVLSLPIIVQDPSGTLDVTFGTGGIATLVIPGATLSSIPGRGLAVQPDGKIAFAGVVNYYYLMVGRFTADGNLDTSFATNGLYTTNQLEYPTEVAYVIRALPAGGLVTAGFGIAEPPSGALWSMVVTKFLDDGGLDTSFGGGSGFVGVQSGDTNAEALDLLVQSDGKLVMGGFQPAGTSALVRLTADGSADPTFEPPTGTSAIAADTYPTAGSCINAIGLLPSGEILAATQLPSGAPNGFLGFQFTSQGVLETSYGTGGTASAPVSSPLNGWLPGGVGMIVQAGGMSVQAGSTSSTIELARFTTGGQLDPTFGPNLNGQVSTSIPGSSTVSVSSIALMPDEGFVVATQFATATPIGVVRYTADGALDTTFAGTGYTGFSGAAAGAAEAVAVDSIGRILLATALNGTVNVARFWP